MKKMETQREKQRLARMIVVYCDTRFAMYVCVLKISAILLRFKSCLWDAMSNRLFVFLFPLLYFDHFACFFGQTRNPLGGI